MRCPTCLLEDPESAALPAEVFQEKLSKCNECPHMTGGPTAALLMPLVKQFRQNTRALRLANSKVRQLTNEANSQKSEMARYEERMTRLEILHRSSSLQLEEQIAAVKSADAARARFVTVLRTTSDFVAMYDANLSPTFLNHALRAALELNLDEDVSNMTLHDFHGPAADELLRVALPHAVEHGFWLGDTFLQSKTHLQINISLAVHVHPATDGKIGFVSMIGRDISAYKELDQLKNDFISTVSHELRTPLTAIRGALGLLAGGVVGPISDDVNELIVMALDNSVRLNRLVNDLLDLEKIGAGKMELQKRPELIADVIATVIRELAVAASGAGVKIVCPNTIDATIEIDKDRIVQVLVNLVGNAIKFSPPDSRVEITAIALPSQSIRIYVRDYGQGIAHEDLDRLFRKFSQVDSSTKRARGGTGLGLAISKALVELHGGTIGVSSEIGKGTTFWFELPPNSTNQTNTSPANDAIPTIRQQTTPEN